MTDDIYNDGEYIDYSDEHNPLHDTIIDKIKESTGLDYDPDILKKSQRIFMFANSLHPLDRVSHKGNSVQSDAFKRVFASDKKYVILEAPTGIGKSAIAAYLSLFKRVLVLTSEKSLQNQYEEAYKFNILKGKGNYPCGVTKYTDYRDKYTAENCACDDQHYMETESEHREVYEMFDSSKSFKSQFCTPQRCAYKRYKTYLKNSDAGCLNYAKFLTEAHEDWNKYDWLVLDEGHELPEITKEHSSLTIKFNNPFLDGLMKLPTIDNIKVIYNIHLARIIERLADNMPHEDNKDAMKKFDRLYQKVTYIKQLLGRALENNEEIYWYAQCTKDQLEIKPLTAKYNFKRLFDRMVGEGGEESTTKFLIMSATIGPWIGDMLGIDPSEIEYISVENLFAPKDRPIYVVENAPKMSGKNTGYGCENHKDLIAQANMIAAIVKKRLDFSHVVLTNSKSHAFGLRNNLIKHGIKCFVPSNEGTEAKLESWDTNRKPGSVVISYSFWTGVNLGDDESIIIAKIPFLPIGGEGSYERASFDFSMKNWRILSALKLVQGAGRVRRGDPSHYGYDKNGKAKRNVFIVDSNFSRIKSDLWKDITDAVCYVTHDEGSFKSPVWLSKILAEKALKEAKAKLKRIKKQQQQLSSQPDPFGGEIENNDAELQAAAAAMGL